MINRIAYQSNSLAYDKQGDGKKVILLFHGFGQDHHAFDAWKEVLKNDYTLFLFDLFFHGESYWESRIALDKSDWKKILDLFFEQEKIEVFDVAGFSLGGKFALATLEAFPTRVKRIILLAPDGIKTNFWYNLATYPIAIRALFKSMILHPHRLHTITKTLRTIGLVDKGLLRFAESQMDTEEKRKRVYFSWVYFRHLRFDLARVANLVNDHGITFTVMVGKHDKVIVADGMNRILKRIENYKLKLIETGHNGIIEKSIAFLWSKD